MEIVMNAPAPIRAVLSALGLIESSRVEAKWERLAAKIRIEADESERRTRGTNARPR